MHLPEYVFYPSGNNFYTTIGGGGLFIVALITFAGIGVLVFLGFSVLDPRDDH